MVVTAVVSAVMLLLIRFGRRLPTHADFRRLATRVEKALPADQPTAELVAAWVQFLRDHVHQSSSALNNRLSAIVLVVDALERGGLSDNQKASMEAIRTEIARAANITGSLVHRASSDAIDQPPPAWHVLQDAVHRPGRILVVDSDESNRVAVTRLLRSLGHQVTAVPGGREAWDELSREPVDCILCDPRMPVLGGRALYEQVTERMPTLARRFVFVTGDYSSAESHAFLESTGQPVIGKPYKVEDLLAAVATVLQVAGVVECDA
ncbi:MAG: response regulator [Gemmatimonadota bacterium]|nr:response regulator [Gemmatimonadota bacterium]